MDNALEQAQQPGTLLQVSGGATAALYGIYGLLGVVGLLFACFGMSANVMLALSADDPTGSLITVALSSWQMIIGILNSLMFIALAAAAFLKVFKAGAAMKELRDLDAVKSGMVFAAGIPIIGLLGNIGLSIIRLDFCGILTWSVPQVLLLILGGAAAYLTNQVLQDETVVSSFSD